jgi:ornithine cyclodeaminase/alanine dehydrogenase-like protein (mu-crystallin family)
MALAERFKLNQAYLVDINLKVAKTCAAELEPKLGFPIEPVSLDDRENAVRKSDIIITVTTGNQALFENAWLKSGVFIARLGSYQEVNLDVITKADKVVVDRWKYISPRIPEIITLVDKGEFSRERVYAEWPTIVAKKVPGRETADEVIVYIALGIWGEYAAILPEVFRKAKSLGIGQDLPCSH